MPLNNPGGSNQMGSFQIQPAYGEVKRETELTREAPMSGAAVATDAVQAPRRAGLRAKMGRPAPGGVVARPGGDAPPPGASSPQTATPPISPEAQAAQVWQAIAQTPGASPLVQQYAAQAASGS